MGGGGDANFKIDRKNDEKKDCHIKKLWYAQEIYIHKQKKVLKKLDNSWAIIRQYLTMPQPCCLSKYFSLAMTKTI